MAITITPEQRKKVLRVLFISLLLDLVRNLQSTLFISNAQRLILNVDIIHLYSPPIPQAPRILPDSRRKTLEPEPPIDPHAHSEPAEPVQEQLRQTNQRPLRHRPARRSARLALLFLSGDRVANHRHALGQAWKTHSAAMVDGREYAQRSALGGRDGFPHVPR